MNTLGYCDSCHKNQATNHITIQVSIFNIKNLRNKFINLALCDECEYLTRRIFEIDRKKTLAKALTSYYELSNFAKVTA